MRQSARAWSPSGRPPLPPIDENSLLFALTLMDGFAISGLLVYTNYAGTVIGSAHSHLNVTMGSTFAARRAGR